MPIHNPRFPDSDGRFPYEPGPQTYNRIGDFVITVGAEAANVVECSIQVRDIRGRPLTHRVSFDFWLSETEWGAVSANTDGLSATTGTIIEELTADSSGKLITDATGLVVLDVTETGATDYYLHCQTGDGITVKSPILSFAA